MRLGGTCIRNILLLANCLLIYAGLYSQQHDLHLQRIGLVGEFSYYKQSAETHAIRIFNHKGLPDSVKSLMVTKYNTLRGGYEQLLMQLISDMHVTKRMHYFKCLDKYFRKGKKKKRGKVADFIANWQSVKAAYDDMINFPTRQYLDSMSSAYDKLKNEELNLPDKAQVYQQDAPVKLDITDPIGSIGSLFKIYRKLSLGDAQKTSNITEVLNTLRMRHASELIAKEDDTAEPDDDKPTGNEAKLTKPLKKKP
jgi:hypothetical protein